MFLYFLSFSDPVQKYIHAFSNTLGFLSLNPTLLPPRSCLLTSSAKQAGFPPPQRHGFLSSYPSPSSRRLPRFTVGLSYGFPIDSNKTVLQLSFNSISTFYFILMRLIQCSYKESLTFPQQYVEVRKEEPWMDSGNCVYSLKPGPTLPPFLAFHVTMLHQNHV